MYAIYDASMRHLPGSQSMNIEFNYKFPYPIIDVHCSLLNQSNQSQLSKDKKMLTIGDELDKIQQIIIIDQLDK